METTIFQLFVNVSQAARAGFLTVADCIKAHCMRGLRLDRCGVVLLFVMWLSTDCSPAAAEVVSAAKDSFTVKTEFTTDTAAIDVWKSLTNVAGWWSSGHTWSGDAKNLKLNPVAGGGFDEILPEGGSVRHLSVVYSSPGKLLRLSGVLGPLQEHALTGTMSIRLTEKEGKTVVTVTYHVAGAFPGGLDTVAPAVDRVLTEQFESLRKQTVAEPGLKLPR